MVEVKAIGYLLRAVSELVFRSVFIGDDEAYRHIPIILNAGLAVTQVIIAGAGALGIAISAILVLLQAALLGNLRSLAYSELLTSLPAIWYLITTLPFTVSVSMSLEIALRVMIVGISLMMFLQRLNPMEIACAFRKVRVREASLFFPLMWKVVPHVMKDMQTALLVADLKGDSIWKGIAISFVAVEEYGKYYDEGLITKKKEFTPKFWYDRRKTVIAAALLIINILVLFVIPYLD